MKVGPEGGQRQAIKYVEGQKFVDEVVESFKALRDKLGSGVDIAVDFHGAVQPPTAMLLMKALEPYNPWFYEEIVQASMWMLWPSWPQNTYPDSHRRDGSLPNGDSGRSLRKVLPLFFSLMYVMPEV